MAQVVMSKVPGLHTLKSHLCYYSYQLIQVCPLAMEYDEVPAPKIRGACVSTWSSCTEMESGGVAAQSVASRCSSSVAETPGWQHLQRRITKQNSLHPFSQCETMTRVSYTVWLTFFTLAPRSKNKCFLLDMPGLLAGPDWQPRGLQPNRPRASVENLLPGDCLGTVGQQKK